MVSKYLQTRYLLIIKRKIVTLQWGNWPDTRLTFIKWSRSISSGMGQTNTMYLLIRCTGEDTTVHSSWWLLSGTWSSSEVLFRGLPFYQCHRRSIVRNLFYCFSRPDSSEVHPLYTLRGPAKTSFNKVGLIHHHPGPPALQESTHFLLPTFIATTCRTPDAGAKETGPGRASGDKMLEAGAKKTRSLGASGQGGIFRGLTRAGLRAKHDSTACTCTKKNQGKGL